MKSSNRESKNIGPNTARGSNYKAKKSSQNMLEGHREGNNDDLAT